MADRPQPSWLKPTVEYGPLAAFFLTYWLGGLMTATAVLIGVTSFGLALSWIVARRIPLMPLVTAVVVAVFGGLTLWFDDPRFVKMKPTIVQALFAIVLFGGLLFKRPLLSRLLGHAWQMDPEGWRRLTFRFALFFASMAFINELVWRTQSTDFWVNFKVFGILTLTLLFAMAQAPLMKRHQVPEEAAADEGPDSPA